MVRIAHLSDLHMETAPEARIPGVRRALRESAALIRQASPDWIVVSGDLTSYGSADPAQLREAQRWLNDLGIPYLVVPGNHDLGANAPRGQRYPDSEYYHAGPWSSTHFAQVFDQRPVVVEQVGPLRLIGMALREGDPDGVLDTVRTELAASDRPTVLIGHYPLIPVQSQGVLATFGEDFVPQVGRALRALIRAHRHVILYAAGHVHAVSVLPLPEGPLQITAGGLGPGASQWWLYEAGETALTYESHDGAGPRTFWDRYVTDGGMTPAYHWNLAYGRRGVIPYVRVSD